MQTFCMFLFNHYEIQTDTDGYTLLYREWLFPVAVGGPTIFSEKIAIFPMIHHLATAMIYARACISGSSSIRLDEIETLFLMFFIFCLF